MANFPEPLSQKMRARIFEISELFDTKQWDECIRACTEFLDLAEQESVDDHFKAIVHNNRGKARYLKGAYDVVLTLEDFDTAIYLDRDLADAYNNRGIVRCEDKGYEGAIQDHDAALEFNRQDSVAYLNRGNAYFGKGDLDQAISDYGTALSIDSTILLAHFGKGEAYYRKEEYDNAIAEYDAELELNHTHAKSRHNRALAVTLKNLQNEEARIREQYQEQLEKQQKQFDTELDKKIQEYSIDFLQIEGYKSAREKYQGEADKTEKRIKNRFIWLQAGVLTALGVSVWIAHILLFRQENEIWPGILPIFPLITVLGLCLFPLIWKIRSLKQEKARLLALSEDAYTKGILAQLINVNTEPAIRKELLNKFFDHHAQHGSAQLIIDLENNTKSGSGAENVIIQHLKDNLPGNN